MTILALHLKGKFRLRKFSTTNKINEDEEILTAKLQLEGNVEAEMFEALTGCAEQGYQLLFWGEDKASAFPVMGFIPLDLEAPEHVVKIQSGVGYKDQKALIRGFKLKPAFGNQWTMRFDVKLFPSDEATIGKIAQREHHDLNISIEGPRDRDLFEEMKAKEARGESTEEQQELEEETED